MTVNTLEAKTRLFELLRRGGRGGGDRPRRRAHRAARAHRGARAAHAGALAGTGLDRLHAPLPEDLLRLFEGKAE